jgi:hypothetical protein
MPQQRQGNNGNWTAAPSPPRQMPLFARKAIIEFPPAKKTADAQGEVEADDGFRYHIKGDAHGRFVRASEWISTHIAEEVGISAPTPMVIEKIDGTSVFGSRRISGVSDDVTTRNFLLTPSQSNISAPIAGLRPLLSAIYTLDLFIHNDDRHFGNYLSIDEGGRRRLYTFDFSRALFWAWPWSGIPAFPCNTRMCSRYLQQLHGFDHVVATTTLDRLGSITPAMIESFINRMPTDWLPNALRDQFLNWWAGPGRISRIQGLQTGLGDGSAL